MSGFDSRSVCICNVWTSLGGHFPPPLRPAPAPCSPRSVGYVSRSVHSAPPRPAPPPPRLACSLLPKLISTASPFLPMLLLVWWAPSVFFRFLFRFPCLVFSHSLILSFPVSFIFSFSLSRSIFFLCFVFYRSPSFLSVLFPFFRLYFLTLCFSIFFFNFFFPLYIFLFPFFSLTFRFLVLSFLLSFLFFLLFVSLSLSFFSFFVSFFLYISFFFSLTFRFLVLSSFSPSV